MSALFFELLILLGLLLINGVFAMAETALVSARRARLEALAQQGKGGASSALALQENPGIFLSTVQVGITLVGIVAGAASGAGLAREIEPALAAVPWLGSWAPPLSMVLVVSVITFLSVVVGELLPKRLAIHAPERWAALLAGPMRRLSQVASPVVKLLDVSSEALVRLFGVKAGQEAQVSEEEVRASIIQGHRAGALKSHEKEMLEGVLELDDLTAMDLMTPKSRIVWINLADNPEQIRQQMMESGHSYFPTYRGTRDHVQGMVSVKSLWTRGVVLDQAGLESVLVPALFVPESMPATRVLEEFRKANRHQALVINEFGAVQGMITLNDMISAIVGALPKEPDEAQQERSQACQMDDGSWLVDGYMDMEEAAARAGLPLPESFESDSYRTLAGFVMHVLGHVPRAGESFTWQGFELQVVDMDRQRIDKVRIRKL